MSQVNGSVPRPNPTSDPPRRAFGSFSKTSSRPTSAQSSNTTLNVNFPSSNTLHPTLSPPSGPTRTRSASSASSTNPAGYTSNAAAAAADRAQQWLHAWAPRGEIRGREFLSSTLNGVASVASTVSNGLNGTVQNIGMNGYGSGNGSTESFGSNGIGSGSTSTPIQKSGFGSRPNSFPATSPPGGIIPPARGFGNLIPPPQPVHTASTPAVSTQSTIPVGRRIPQPSNMSRLGSNPSVNPIISPTNGSLHRPSLSHPTNSTTSLPPSIPRSTSGNVGPGSGLAPHRTSSHRSANNHNRTSSFGALSPSLSRSSSVNINAQGPGSATGRNLGTPYKVGFQPAGVKNDRSAEFFEDRRRGGSEREKEEGRLGRRWAKLIDLHFNPTLHTTSQNPQPNLTRSSSSSFSLSSMYDKRRSILSIDGALDALKPREVWKGLKGVASGPSGGQGGDEARKRAAEQAIVKWEDDAEVKRCRICQSSFSLSNRKHHCRLCGRIVCSLPPTPPALLAVQIQLFSPAHPESESSTSQSNQLPQGTRREKCSLLLVADWKSGRGEEVDEGFVGWMSLVDPEKGEGDLGGRKKERRKSRLSISSGSGDHSVGAGKDGPPPMQAKEVPVKGVRVCRECWTTVSRKQKIQDRQRSSGFVRLYTALRSLQAEIEDILPDYEEQVYTLTSHPTPQEPPPETLQLHKTLLTLFSQYDQLSKRIANLPCEDGGSQSQVQNAIARAAVGFLGREMGKVQALPNLQKKSVNAKKMQILETTLTEQLGMDDSGGSIDEVDDAAIIIQPLLEQEAQLETMISDANAQRKYEDGKALSEALGEIRAEIARLTKRAI